MSEPTLHGGKTGGVRVAVEVDQAQLAAIEAELAQIANGVPNVLTRALNKVGTAARTQIVRGISREVNLTAGELRNRNVSLYKANYGRLAASIIVSGRRIPLKRWGARQTRRGVSYAIRRGSRQTMPQAFLATMKSGHVGAFVRKPGTAEAPRLRRRMTRLQGRRRKWMSLEEARKAGSRRGRAIVALDAAVSKAVAAGDRRVARLPIGELYGPSVPEVMGGVAELSQAVLDDQLRRDLADEIDTQVGLVIARRSPRGGR